MKVLSCGNQLHPDVSSLDKGDYSDKHCIEGFFFFFLPLINFFYKQFLNPMKEKNKKRFINQNYCK